MEKGQREKEREKKNRREKERGTPQTQPSAAFSFKTPQGDRTHSHKLTQAHTSPTTESIHCSHALQSTHMHALTLTSTLNSTHTSHFLTLTYSPLSFHHRAFERGTKKKLKSALPLAEGSNGTLCFRTQFPIVLQ